MPRQYPTELEDVRGATGIIGVSGSLSCRVRAALLLLLVFLVPVSVMAMLNVDEVCLFV